MKFFLKIILLCLALILLLSGCADVPTAKEGYRFTDDLGETVTVAETPKRVAVLFSSYAEMWTLSGGEIAITVGESVERGFADESTPLVDAGAGKSISVETLIGEAPDFVIASADIPAQVEAASLLRKMGIPAACFRVESFADYERVMAVFTDITGDKEAYEAEVLAVRTGIEEILNAAEGRSSRILFIRCGSGYSATKAKGTKDHFVAGMLAELGCENIADSATVLLDGLSIETILAEDPDYIFFSTMGDEEKAKQYMESVMLQPLWQSLDAVKNNRYVFLPKSLFHYKPNARWDEAYAFLKERVYGNENGS